MDSNGGGWRCTVLIWLAAIRQSQLAPHHIHQHIGSQTISDYWTTNNLSVTWDSKPVLANGNFVDVVYPVTNELWHVWAMFKK